MSALLKRWRDWLPLLIILAVGATLRFYQIGWLPPGLYRDEAFYGLDALNVLRGHPALYFAANNGREGMFMYMLAGSIALFGRTPEALRITSAAIGTATILAIYFAGRNLFSHRIGVLSAAILALTFWHLAISRVAFRAITLPLLLCLTVAFGAATLRGLSSNTRTSPWLAFAAGVCFGLTFYTYSSAQFLWPLAGAFALIVLVERAFRNGALRNGTFRNPISAAQTLRRTLYATRNRVSYSASVFVFLAGVLLVLAPFLVWLMRHADLYFMRAEQVSILSPTINHGDVWGTLWGNWLKAAGMFVFQGDRIWRHNLSLRPVFDGVIATTFVLGVLVSAWRVWRVGRLVADATKAAGYSSLFILLWLVIFLIPTVLAEDTPHFLRAIGALPVACIMAAVGLEALLAWLSRRGLLNLYFGRIRRLVSPPALVAAVVLVVTAVSTVSDYFEVYAHKDMTAYWLEAHNVPLAQAINQYAHTHPPQTVWLEDRLANDNPALRFLSPDVEQGHVTIISVGQPPVAPSRAQVLLLVDPNHDWTALRNALPPSSTLSVSEGPLAQGDLDPSPHRAFIAIQADPYDATERNAAILEQGISLKQVGVGAGTGVPVGTNQLPISNDQLFQPPFVQTLTSEARTVYTFTLFWSTTRPLTEDYAVFVHWVRGGQVIAQHDSSPVNGYLPMPVWRAGDVIADQHVLQVPGGLQKGDQVRTGIYRRSDNTRLRLMGQDGSTLTDSIIVIDAR
ncbi:MAG: glycosyltransferase family 39 protein [Chloroflexi bacterium]|nr:glycosyltransferase family 39 protein [Chloroflexota bacterium]